MKSSREFTDSVFAKYEEAKKAEVRENVWKKKTIKYVSTLAACIVLVIGIIGLNVDTTPDIPGVNTGSDPAVTEPADPGSAETPEDGAAEIPEDSTPLAGPQAENPDYRAAVGTLEGVGIAAIIIAAGGSGVYYYRKKRKY